MNDRIQWTGAVFIIAMHVGNAIGPAAYPYTLIAAVLGTVCFMLWSFRVRNRPQLLVNLVAMSILTVGLFKAFG
jgi:type IV secretory pathway TrbL component